MNRRHAVRSIFLALLLAPVAAQGMPGPATAADPVGTYDLTMSGEGHEEQGVLVVTRTQGELGGTLTLHGQPFRLESVEFDAAKQLLTASVAGGQLKVSLTFETADRIAGSVVAHEKTGTLSGMRRK